jgi:GWxTD domain-containing protein
MFYIIQNLFKYGLIAFIILNGCARSFNPEIDMGSGYELVPGTPDVRMDAKGFLDDDDNPFINVIVQINKNSLIYRSDFNKRFSEIEIDIRIVDLITSESRNYIEVFIVDDPSQHIGEGMYFVFSEDYEIKPGDHSVTVTVTDKISDKRSVRTDRAYIFDPKNPQTNITSIRLSGFNPLIDPDNYSVISTYDVPAINDSLKFRFLVSNQFDDKPLTLKIRLLQFQSDREPAYPLAARNHSPNSLPFVGFRFRNPDVIEEFTMNINTSGSFPKEIILKRPDEGNYRFEVTIDTKSQGGSENLFRARDFSVKSANYPHILSAREMAAPLVYLMSRSEHRRLMQIEDSDSLQLAVARFWLSNLPPNQAKSSIEMFYERVEQANMFFSSFKEGWKTDMGRVYIMFGPPISVEPTHNQMIWAYTFDLNDPLYNITFRRTRPPSEFFPFDHYLVVRNSEFFSLEYQQQQRWVQGLMR